jgi:hypothetical protein
MARNSYKPLGWEPTPSSLVTPPRPAIPSITRPEKIINPEARKERFKRLASILKPPKV